ncbi:hypothetical protein H0H92_015806 [Tricholoma furcatifolium]|nr:hypothetical protein H0H92_015806 [Tricholoma furcatifolium]
MSVVRAGKTESVQELEALHNIQCLLDDGGKGWFHHMERLAANNILAVGFGIRGSTKFESDLSDSILNVIFEGIDLVSPSASIINVLPFLDWIPGPVSWRVRAQSFRKREKAIYDKLFDEALLGRGSGVDTWAAFFAGRPDGDQRHLLDAVTASALHTFILACICHPDWLSDARNSIDEVVGEERMPSFQDRASLPYVDALVRARIGIPHQTTESDVIEYNGEKYSIPEGSIIFAVQWAIEHDASRFTDPDRFIPSRFLDGEGKLKAEYETSAFGHGRRLCPGIPFAERTLWIAIAMILWTFDISGSEEPNAKTGLPFHYDTSDAGFLPGISARPHKFPAMFRARSEKRAEVARREWDIYEKELQVLLPAL